MFTIFEGKGSVTSRGFQNFVRFDTYRRYFYVNVLRMMDYYRKNPFAVRGDHIFVRLLQSISIPYTTPVEKYYEAVQDIAYELGGHMKITNPFFDGTHTDKPFILGGKNIEYPFLMHGRGAVDFVAFERDWKKIKAVRFVRHAKTDLSLEIPNGDTSCHEEGMVVYQIDLPALALQHRMFKLEQFNKPSGSRLGTHHFVHMYVLSGMIESMIDVAFFNRMHAKLKTEFTGSSEWRYVIGLPDQYRFIDQYIEDVVEQVDGNRYSYQELLNYIKVITPGKALIDVVKMPDVVTTRQINWLLYCAQLPMVNFLMELDYRHDATINNTDNNALKRDLRFARNDNLFRRNLPSKLYEKIAEELDRVKVVY